jgi:hypothetical protein
VSDAQQVYDEAMHALEKAVIAIDASLSTLVLAREALMDRAQDLSRAHQGGKEQPPEQDPTAVMGQPVPENCAHTAPAMETETMAGLIRFCGDCGQQL